MERENRFLENFFYADEVFCSTIEDLVEHLEIDEDIEDLPEDWEVQVELTELERVFEVDDDFLDSLVDWAIDANEERFDPENYKTVELVKQAFISGIDKEKITKALPELYYGTGRFVTITKKDLLCCK
jgi:hypothetical protein